MQWTYRSCKHISKAQKTDKARNLWQDTHVLWVRQQTISQQWPQCITPLTSHSQSHKTLGWRCRLLEGMGGHPVELWSAPVRTRSTEHSYRIWVKCSSLAIVPCIIYKCHQDSSVLCFNPYVQSLFPNFVKPIPFITDIVSTPFPLSIVMATIFTCTMLYHLVFLCSYLISMWSSGPIVRQDSPQSHYDSLYMETGQWRARQVWFPDSRHQPGCHSLAY